MRILQVIPYFYFSWSRDRLAESVDLIYNLSRSLLHRGHEVTIYTTDAINQSRKPGYRTDIINIDGIEVREFKSLGRKLGQSHHICISPAMIPAMGKEIDGFDVVHLHEYRTFQNILAHHYAKKNGVPYVLQAHGSLPRIVSKMRLKQAYDNLWGYRLLRDASKVIAVTGMEVEQYETFGVKEDKIETIPNGVDLSVFDNLPARGEFRKKHGLGDDQKIILYLGRIHKIKGLDLLAEVFSDLSRAQNDVKLVIVGQDDGYLASLNKLVADLEISDRVLFTGPLYRWDKLSAYVDADVYVLPSIYEIFGVTIIEALACGTPVIVTEQCGIADVIGGQAGLVVPYDREPLKDALLTMLTNDESRREFGEKGKSLVREKFSWEIIAKQVEEVYREVLK